MLDFDTIKRYYDAGAWSAVMVNKAVTKGVITAAQCTQIVGG